MLIGEGISPAAATTEALGRSLGEALVEPAIWSLCGDLGSGKTVLARGLLRGLGIAGPVRSPTFTLAIPYQGRLPAVHVDLYRLESAAAIEFLEWDDWLAAGTVLLVEWGERATAVIGADCLQVRLEHRGGDQRWLQVVAAGSTAARLGPDLRRAWDRTWATI